MTAAATVAGLALMAVVLRDLFHTIWHPGAQGTLARRILAGVWRVCRAGRRASLTGLAVVPSRVADAADWWEAADRGVGAVMVVGVQPGRQGGGALG